MGRRPPSPSQSQFPLAPLVCFGLAALLAFIPFARRLEWRTLDTRVALRTHFQRPPSPELAIVLFGNHSDADLAPWPVDRKWHAQLMKLMVPTKPAVVAWDIIFDAPGKSPEGDKLMAGVAGAMTRIGIPVISAAVTDANSQMGRPAEGEPTQAIGRIEGDVAKLYGDAYAVLPFPELRAASRYGFADTPPGADGIRRELPVVVRVAGKVYPSLGLTAVLAYLHVDPADVLVRLGDAVQFTAGDRLWRIPISERGTYWVNYRYDVTESGTEYETAEYSKAIFALDARFVHHDAQQSIPNFKGRIVLVGEIVAGKADSGPTPLGGYSPLVLVHANFIDNVLRGDFIRRWPVWAVCLALAALTQAAYGWMQRRAAPIMALFAVLGIAVYLTAACVLWISASIWVPVIGPVAGLVALNFEIIIQRVRNEQRAKERMRAKFQSYLPPELIKKRIDQGESLEVRSERRPVTILFSDLRDFTGWSERVGEEELITQLNEYLAAMVECIHENGGTLNKFIGDAVMAAWGDFVTEGSASDAERACRAAFSMQARLAELNVGWTASGRQALRMGIGLNHGLVLVGDVGSPRRMEFTLIGDAVNLASRFESLTKDYGASILAGESVQALVGDRFEFRPLGAIPVKGKVKPISVYELMEDNLRLTDQNWTSS